MAKQGPQKPSNVWILKQPADRPAKEVAEAAVAAGFPHVTTEIVYQTRSTHRHLTRGPYKKTGKRGPYKKRVSAKAGKTTAREALRVAKAAAVRVPVSDPHAVLDALRRLAIRHGTTALRFALDAIESE
jgi:hypothetical protein